MKFKTTAILAVVCVAVFAYLFLVVKPFEQKPEATDKTTEKVDKKLLDPEPEGIDRVEVSRRDGKSLVFVRDGKDEWKMAAPIEGTASKFEVDALVNSVATMKIEREYAKDNPNRPGPAVSGLDKPLGHVKLMKDGKVLLAEVKIGSRVPTGMGNYVELVGKDTIYVSKMDLNRQFTNRVEDYRDKRVLKFEYNDVQKVKAEGVRGFELVKGTGDTWTLESPVHALADKSKVDSMVRPLTTLRADQFVDDKPDTLKLYGLDNPRLKITVETKETIPAKAEPGDPDTQPADTQPSVESRTYVLSVGGPTDPKEESYFAQVDGMASVFTIRQDTFKSISPSETDIRDKLIAKVEADRVKKIEASTPDGGMTLTKQADGKWRFADGTEADATLAGDLVKAAANLKAAEFLDPRKELVVLDWNSPRAKLVLTQEGEVNPETVLVGPASASGKMVYVRNAAQEDVAAVPAPSVNQLLQPPVSYRNRSVMSFDREEITGILIDRNDPQAPASARHILLAKRDQKWSMVEPVSGPADEETVRNLLQDLSSLPARRVVAVGDKAKYGLDKPGVIVTMTAEMAAPAAETQPTTMPASGPARDVAVLNQLIEYQKTNPNENPQATEMLKKMLAEKLTSMPAGDAPAAKPAGKTYALQLSLKDAAVYACRPGDEVVYELDRKVYDDVISEMYDHQVVRFETADVVEVAFKTSAAQITLRKAGDEWKYIEDPLVRIDGAKVTDVLSAFKDLKTGRFADYNAADMNKYGLGDSAERISFGLKEGREIVLLLSPMGPAGDPSQSMRYGAVGGTSRVFLLQGQQVAKFRQRVEDFQKHEAAPTPAFNPNAPPGG